MLSLSPSLIECCACARENNDPRQVFKLSPAVDPRRSRAKRWGAGGNAIVAQCGEFGFELGVLIQDDYEIHYVCEA